MRVCAVSRTFSLAMLSGILFAVAGLSAAEVEADALTVKLAEMIRTAEKQAGSGDGSEALATLEKAKTLATEAKRAEAEQIDARIARLKEGLAQQKKVTEDLKSAPAAPAGAVAGKPDVGPAARPAVTLSQDECVEIAMQNNLGLRLARLSDRVSDLDLKDAWAAYLPTIDAALGKDRKSVV
jgi:hypothetical protein